MAEDHSSGRMDITAQERTFDGFLRALRWGSALAIAILVLLALINS